MNNSNSSDRSLGFTLLELLVSIAVFSVMSVMAYGGLKNVIDNSEASRDAMLRLEKVQKTMSTLGRDLSQIFPREVTNSYGDPKQYVIADERSELLVEFTRSGRRNPAGMLRSSLQRVAYRVEEDKLYRVIWRSLDQAQGEDPLQAALIDKVEAMEFRFLDQNNKWHEVWPPLNSTLQGAEPSSLLAVEFKLTLSDWGELNRIYEVVEP